MPKQIVQFRPPEVATPENPSAEDWHDKMSTLFRQLLDFDDLLYSDLSLTEEFVERFLGSLDNGEPEQMDLDDYLIQSMEFFKTACQFRHELQVSAAREKRIEQLLEIAESLVVVAPDWRWFHGELFRTDGVVHRLFPDAVDYDFFLGSTVNKQILAMCSKLQESPPDQARSITLELSGGVVETLEEEAAASNISLNQLCASRLSNSFQWAATNSCRIVSLSGQTDSFPPADEDVGVYVVEQPSNVLTASDTGSSRFARTHWVMTGDVIFHKESLPFQTEPVQELWTNNFHSAKLFPSSFGRKAIRHNRGSGRGPNFYIVDFVRNKDGVLAVVEAIQDDRNRQCRIALVVYQDGYKSYVLAPQDLRPGMVIQNGPTAPIAVGNCLPLSNIPVGTGVCCVELSPGHGGVLCRSAGSITVIVNSDNNWVQLRVPSGEVRRVPSSCRATIGRVANSRTTGKAKKHKSQRLQT